MHDLRNYQRRLALVALGPRARSSSSDQVDARLYVVRQSLALRCRGQRLNRRDAVLRPSGAVSVLHIRWLVHQPPPSNSVPTSAVSVCL